MIIIDLNYVQTVEGIVPQVIVSGRLRLCCLYTNNIRTLNTTFLWKKPEFCWPKVMNCSSIINTNLFVTTTKAKFWVEVGVAHHWSRLPGRKSIILIEYHSSGVALKYSTLYSVGLEVWQHLHKLWLYCTSQWSNRKRWPCIQLCPNDKKYQYDRPSNVTSYTVKQYTTETDNSAGRHILQILG